MTGATAPRLPPLPEPLPGPALDSHCHLDMIERPVAEVLADARSVGIVRVVTVGCDVPSSRWAASCAGEHRDVYAAVAIHPNETRGRPRPRPSATTCWRRSRPWRSSIRSGRSARPGWTTTGTAPRRALQQEWFRAHIQIAKQAGKALMIHDREAHDDVLRILDSEGPPDQVIFHCFSGDAAMVKRCAEAGYVMSFAGNVTFASAQPLRDAAAAAPADLILAETDAPFLTPMPNRGKPNSPAMVAATLRALADVKQLPLAELCEAVSATAERVFGPWRR